MTKEQLASLPKGTTIYTILRHVSRSGMSRVICPVVVVDGEIRWVNLYDEQDKKKFWHKWDRKEDGYRLSGCGMDMGFALVYDLGMYATGDGSYFNHCWL